MLRGATAGAFVLMFTLFPSVAHGATASHAPIDITGDRELFATAKSERWPGAGTPADPFRIEGYRFDEGDVKVRLTDTTLAVVISGNVFAGGVENLAQSAAVSLSGVADVEVSGNETDGHLNGVEAVDSRDVSVRDNVIRPVARGIVVSMSTGVDITGNTVTADQPWAGYGIASGLNDDATIAENRVTGAWPIGISASGPGVDIRGNSVTGRWTHAAIRVRRSHAPLIRDNIVSGGEWQANIELGNTWPEDPVDDAVVAGNRVEEPQPTWTDGVSVFGRGAEVRGNRFTGARVGVRTLIPDAGAHVVDNEVVDSNTGVMVTGGTIVEHNTLHDLQAGVWAVGDVTVAFNEMVDLSGTAVEVFGPGARVVDNTVDGAFLGIRAAGSSNHVARNDVSDAERYGVRLEGAGHTAADNTLRGTGRGIEIWDGPHEVTGNAIEGQGVGIWGRSASGNLIAHNRLVGNAAGLQLLFESSEGNLIYDNLFDNSDNLLLENPGVNTWNVDPVPGPNVVGGPYIAGNWWNDYLGADLDGDGLGDVPHDLVGATGVAHAAADGLTFVGDTLNVSNQPDAVAEELRAHPADYRPLVTGVTSLPPVDDLKT